LDGDGALFRGAGPDGGGTGLGLAVSLGIVKDHDGWIDVETRPDGGARLRACLPSAAA